MIFKVEESDIINEVLTWSESDQLDLVLKVIEHMWDAEYLEQIRDQAGHEFSQRK